jgi:hypothetical protein
MRRGTESIQKHRLRNGGETRRPTDPNTDRLASLASMTMARQNPGLVLPSISKIPTSYTHTKGADATLALARSLVKLDIGSRGLWERHNGNLSLFIRSSLNQWLGDIGALQLRGSVDIDLAIVDDLQGVQPKEKGNLFILLETSDGCGFLRIGKALESLENEHAGLGRAFYIVLSLAMNSWVDVYDLKNAEFYVDRWKESIEMDLEGEGELTEESFKDYCRANDLSFPDLSTVTPACAKDISFYNESRRLNRSIDLLKKHRDGQYAEWINPVLTMAELRKPKRGLDHQEIDGVWDDGPLPNWIVAFEAHDPITQAFDDESQCMNEATHAPTWIDSFDPSDANEVKKVLNYVQNFVLVNQQIVKLAKCFEKVSKTSGSTHKSEFDDELRAA